VTQETARKLLAERVAPTAATERIVRELGAGTGIQSRAESHSLVHRAFALLSCFSNHEHTLTLVNRTGLPTATVHRLAGQLIEVGALERVGREYKIGVRIFQLSGTVWSQRVLRNAATPYLQELFDEVHETISLASLQGSNVLYIDRLRGHGTVSLPVFPGDTMPAHCTGLGKAMLAFSSGEQVRSVVSQGLKPRSPRTITAPQRFLDQLTSIKRTGVALDAEESVDGVCCVAAPIIGPDGKAFAALSVASTTARMRRIRIAAVRESANRISIALRRLDAAEGHRDRR
jgi:IclR family acetate operon transcriptional repressor